jgi:hypothetical protein
VGAARWGQHGGGSTVGAARWGQHGGGSTVGRTSWSFARASSCFFLASFESSVTFRAVRPSAAPPQSAAVTVTGAHGPHATRGHVQRSLGGAAAECGDSSCDGQREIAVQHARGATARTGAIEGRARSDRRVCGSAIDAFTLARSSCIENPRVMCNSASVQHASVQHATVHHVNISNIYMTRRVLYVARRMLDEHDACCTLHVVVDTSCRMPRSLAASALAPSRAPPRPPLLSAAAPTPAPRAVMCKLGRSTVLRVRGLRKPCSSSQRWDCRHWSECVK